jgi:hypothetical protein
MLICGGGGGESQRPIGRPVWGLAWPRIHLTKLTPFSRYFVSQCIAKTDVSIVLRVYKDTLWVANLCLARRQKRVAAQRA